MGKMNFINGGVPSVEKENDLVQLIELLEKQFRSHEKLEVDTISRILTLIKDAIKETVTRIDSLEKRMALQESQLAPPSLIDPLDPPVDPYHRIVDNFR